MKLTDIVVELPMYPFVGSYTTPDSIDLIMPFLKHVMYSGFPGSILNGGRSNQVNDDPRIYLGEAEFNFDILGKVRTHYFDSIKKLNKRGIAVFVAYTTSLPFDEYPILNEQLNDENAEPLRRLAELGDKYKDQLKGQRNGVIVANPNVEKWVRSIIGNDLEMVASCISFYKKGEKLSTAEKVEAYRLASERFDQVVLTPQDITIKAVMQNLPEELKPKFVGLVNSQCLNSCVVPYEHYLQQCLSNLFPYIKGDKVMATRVEQEYKRLLAFVGANYVCGQDGSTRFIPIEDGFYQRTNEFNDKIRTRTENLLKGNIGKIKVGRLLGKYGYIVNDDLGIVYQSILRHFSGTK